MELVEEAVNLYFRLPKPECLVYFMLLDRATAVQIAEHLGMSLATVYRIKAHLEFELREHAF